MIDKFNLLILCLIIVLLVGTFFKKHRILPCLFLIGLTQIGAVYPAIVGTLRFEYIVGIISIFVILISRKSLEKIVSLESQVNKYFLLFVLATIFSIPFAFSVPDSAQWFLYYFKRCFIYYFLIVVLLDSVEKINNFIWIYIIGIFWLAVNAVVSFTFNDNTVLVDGVERVLGATGILSNPNGLANTIVQTLPFIYYFAVGEDTKWKKIVLILIGILGFIAIFMTGSRGGFIGLSVTIFIIAVFSKHKIIAIGVAFVIVFASLMIIDPSLLSRYETILHIGEYDTTGRSRWQGLMHGISMFIKRPILGVGIGCYPIARAEWFDWALWAHNTYGQLIGELGILGTLAWSLLVYYTVKSARKIRNYLKEQLPNEHTILYYLMFAIEVSTYVRLVLGMTTHSLHIFFWYVNAALVFAVANIVYSEKVSCRKEGELNLDAKRTIKT